MKKSNWCAQILKVVLLALFCTISAAAQTTKTQKKTSTADLDWTWSDKLDAVNVASKNHHIVYEDQKVRVLQVICPPGSEEPVHTHQYSSTMWFTHSARFMYYTYVASKNGRLVKKDSVEVKGFPAEALNKGQKVDREGPHSVKNISTDTLLAYRIEYKLDFKN